MIIETIIGLAIGAAAAARKPAPPTASGVPRVASGNQNTAAGQALKAGILATAGNVQMPDGTLVVDARVPVGQTRAAGLTKAADGTLKVDMRIMPGAVSSSSVAQAVKAPVFNPAANTPGVMQDRQAAASAAVAKAVANPTSYLLATQARLAQRKVAQAQGADYDDGT